ncbi:hypothetical protein FHR71_002009 [Methylobacterium sp. RAS18]|nr:hypothetical protein [Methylobacterium sp. RAS18]
MIKISTFLGATAIVALTTTSTIAAPCNTQGKQTAGDKSSSADHSTKNLADGQQPSAPKTVGAMNNMAANRATSPADVTLQAEGKGTMAQQGQSGSGSQGQHAGGGASSDADRSTKNLAGGQQPSAPKTVGAMNNVGASQLPGKQGQADDGC